MKSFISQSELNGGNRLDTDAHKAIKQFSTMYAGCTIKQISEFYNAFLLQFGGIPIDSDKKSVYQDLAL